VISGTAGSVSFRANADQRWSARWLRRVPKRVSRQSAPPRHPSVWTRERFEQVSSTTMSYIKICAKARFEKERSTTIRHRFSVPFFLSTPSALRSTCHPPYTHRHPPLPLILKPSVNSLQPKYSTKTDSFKLQHKITDFRKPKHNALQWNNEEGLKVKFLRINSVDGIRSQIKKSDYIFLVSP
jgi:hypothetical protein